MNKRLLSLAAALFVTLGSWKGYLAIFEGNSPEPRQIYPLKVETLPPVDQQALEDGILIRSNQRLEQLLEDYLS